jgi:hypothetical protein
MSSRRFGIASARFEDAIAKDPAARFCRRAE